MAGVDDGPGCQLLIIFNPPRAQHISLFRVCRLDANTKAQGEMEEACGEEIALINSVSGSVRLLCDYSKDEEQEL